MKANISLRLELKDLATNEIKKTIEQKGNSLVRNFLDLVLGSINNINRDCKDLAGNTYTIRFGSDFNASGLLGIIGTSNSPESIEDYTLENYIVCYRTRDFSITQTTTGYTLTIRFDFEISNSYTIKEVGIYQQLYDTSGNARNILLIRNVLSTPLDITEPSILTLTYTIEWGV